MSQFQFVGGSSTASSKISWAPLAQALVIRASVVDGLSPTDAFARGIEEFNAQADEAERMPTALPASYTNKNAGSILYGLKQRFLKKVNDESARGHAEAREAAIQVGIIEPTDEA
jgi:hypothetical protein